VLISVAAAAWLLIVVTAGFKHRWVTLLVAVSAPFVPLLAHVLAVKIRWLQGDGWAPTFAADMVGLALGVIFLVGAALVAAFGSNRRPPKHPSGPGRQPEMLNDSQVATHFVSLWMALALLFAGCSGNGDQSASSLPAVTTTATATTTSETSLPPPSTTAPTTTTTSLLPTTEALPATSASPESKPPATPRTSIPDIASGLFCRDVAALGHDYGRAVEYWILEGRPDRMDADRDGIPCETVYTASDVMAYWNPPVVIQASGGYDVQLAGGRIVVPSRAGASVFTPSELHPEWVETRLEPLDRLPGELFPRGAASAGDNVAVGAVRLNLAESDSFGPRGVVYLFTAENGDWRKERIEIDLVPVDVERFTVTAMDDDRIVVRSGLGDLIMLVPESNGWSQLRIPTDVLQDGCPECPVDISGRTIAVGHPWLGGVFVFGWNGSDWTEQRLPALGCGHMDGSSIDIEGDRILVGADGHSPGPGGPACIYLQTRVGPNWVSELIAEGGEGLGEDLRLSGDVVLATARSDIFIYRKVSGSWKGSSLEFDFEWIDALDADGQHIAISNSGSLREPGSVRVFDMPLALRIDAREI